MYFNWQTSALHTWPLQPAPLTAYTTYGLNLLTPAQLQNTEVKQNVQVATVQPPALQTSPNFGHFLTPQYLTAQQQYFAFNSAFFNAPFGQYAYTTGQQYLPQLFATLPSITQKLPMATPKVTTTTTTEAPTHRPNIRNREPTTRKPQGSLQVKPPKLQLQPEDVKENSQDSQQVQVVQPYETTEIVGGFKSDTALLKAVEKINPEYVIEEIIKVPGKHVFSTETTEQIKTLAKQTKPQKQTVLATEQKPAHIQKQNVLAKQQKQKQIKKSAASSRTAANPTDTSDTGVKVEAIGKTSTKGNIPEIPFGTYFLPYFSQDQQQQQQSGKKTASLILEPHSKAIVGNGGTAISTPFSRAYLKRGVTTNVYFNPESVAIAGVGGKAHAQADLELDLID
ncbi:uncharacterized protein LOC135954194 [Calliphora vicina]|uniref:uncharacterized protein LOC135954194 n=1 Tax=Calliphora vicina TaxID=7373 RepID=UPI00325C2D43